MKNANIENLLLLMVAAGWGRSSITSVLDDIRNANPYALEDHLDFTMQMREELASGMGWSNKKISSYSGYISSESYKKQASGKHYSDLYLKLKAMLVDELNLTTNEIVDLLSMKLPKGHIPPLAKKSLANWLERLSFQYSPSEILHAATLILDDYKKRNRLDWNVRNE